MVLMATKPNPDFYGPNSWPWVTLCTYVQKQSNYLAVSLTLHGLQTALVRLPFN